MKGPGPLVKNSKTSFFAPIIDLIENVLHTHERFAANGLECILKRLNKTHFRNACKVSSFSRGILVIRIGSFRSAPI